MKLSGLVTLCLAASVDGFASLTKPKSLGTRAIPKKSLAKAPPAKKPAAKKVFAQKPAAKKVVTEKPAAKKLFAQKPPAKKIVAEKPAAKKLFAQKPAAKKIVAKKPAAKKFVAKKTAPKKVVAKTPAPKKVVKNPLPRTIKVEDLPGVLPPVGFFDPLGFAEKANDNLILKYREAELTHGRVAMVAFLGFLFGELASGYNGILSTEVTGYAIGQIDQVPGTFWAGFWAAAFAVETARNQNAVVDPTKTSRSDSTFGTYNPQTLPGDIGFDPLGLKPTDPAELKIMQTKELQHGRVAMIASSGFLAQELVDKKGIVEHAVDSVTSLFN